MAASGGESVVDELPDVFVAEVFQPYGADRGDEVVVYCFHARLYAEFLAPAP